MPPNHGVVKAHLVRSADSAAENTKQRQDVARELEYWSILESCSEAQALLTWAKSPHSTGKISRYTGKLGLSRRRVSCMQSDNRAAYLSKKPSSKGRLYLAKLR